MAFIGICSDSNFPALRIRVQPRPYFNPNSFTSLNKPNPPDTEGISPFKVEKIQQEYQLKLDRYNQSEAEKLQAISLYEQDLKQREVIVDREFDQFKTQLQPLLEQPATCQNTDVWGALNRIDLFLNEDTSTWNLQPRNFAVLITDGEHNTEHQPFQMQSNAEILLVNGAGEVGVLDSLNYKAFEAPSSAFQYLVNILNQKEVAND